MEHFWKHPGSSDVKEVLPEVRDNQSTTGALSPPPTTPSPLFGSFSPSLSASSPCHTKGLLGGGGVEGETGRENGMAF